LRPLLFNNNKALLSIPPPPSPHTHPSLFTHTNKLLTPTDISRCVRSDARYQLFTARTDADAVVLALALAAATTSKLATEQTTWARQHATLEAVVVRGQFVQLRLFCVCLFDDPVLIPFCVSTRHNALLCMLCCVVLPFFFFILLINFVVECLTIQVRSNLHSLLVFLLRQVAASARSTELQQLNYMLLAELDSLACSAQRSRDKFVSRVADVGATVRRLPKTYST
jgi:hypothetical protein